VNGQKMEGGRHGEYIHLDSCAVNLPPEDALGGSASQAGDRGIERMFPQEGDAIHVFISRWPPASAGRRSTFRRAISWQGSPGGALRLTLVGNGRKKRGGRRGRGRRRDPLAGITPVLADGVIAVRPSTRRRWR